MHGEHTTHLVNRQKTKEHRCPSLTPHPRPTTTQALCPRPSPLVLFLQLRKGEVPLPIFPFFFFFLYPHTVAAAPETGAVTPQTSVPAPVTVARAAVTGAVAPLWRQSLAPRRQLSSRTDALAPVCHRPSSVPPHWNSKRTRHHPPCPYSSSATCCELAATAARQPSVAILRTWQPENLPTGSPHGSQQPSDLTTPSDCGTVRR